MHFQTKISQITMYFQSKNTKNDAFQSTICLIQYKACTLVMNPNHNCNMPLDFVQWLRAGLHPC